MSSYLKSRGKAKVGGEWIYGYLVERYNGHFYIDHYGEFGYTLTEIDPQTTGRNTGISDLNGREIIEGDIILDPDIPNHHYIVKYEDAAFIAYDRALNESCCLREFMLFGKNQAIVVGNIHDNPELMEV